MRALSSSILLFAALTRCVYAQAASEIIAGGYTTPATGIAAAPGQVLTLFVRGISAPDAIASGFPLPASLSGISVQVKVACCNPPSYPSALPIFKVHSEDACSGGRGVLPCPLTQVTVQIPTEPLCIPNGFPNSCTIGPPKAIVLHVSANGAAGQDFPVTVGGPKPHFLNTCDTVLSGSGICNWLITHADGSAVSGSTPAKAGETIVLYAVGLGFADPSVPTGSPAKSPAFAADPLFYPVNVSFRAELPPASPAPPVTYVPAGQYFYPAFVGLVSGYVGLYQVNFTVPTPPSQTHRCASGADTNTRIQFASTGDNYVDVCVAVP